MNPGKFNLVEALNRKELHKGYPGDNSSLMSIKDIFRSEKAHEDPTKYPAW